MKQSKMRNCVWLAVLSSAMVFGCAGSDCMDETCDADFGYDFSVNRAPLAAKCSIYVSGYGAVDIETDYVPNVTACESGDVGTAALQAQAISARTFAYYKLNNGAGTSANPVKNSEDDQVYKCSYTKAAAKHFDATNATSGVVLTYSNKPICAFFVAGCTKDFLNADCKYNGSSACKASTQKYVTYNYGKTGTGVTQTTLGWVNAGNTANRGCLSQNGASCLSNAGKDYKYILQYFYGSDIGFTQAEGSCVAAKTCDTKIAASGGMIDDSDNCFTRSSSTAWYELSKGYGDHLYYTYVWDKAAEVVGTWKLNMASAGTYKVEAYIQSSVTPLSEKAPYVVRAKGVETKKTINLSGKSGWVEIGTFAFAAGSDQYVKLSDASGEPYTDKNGKRIVFDAIRLTPASTCTDACTNGAKECSGNGYRTCSKGSNGCTSWSAVTACGSDQKCSGGACVAAQTCTDACTNGAKECSGNGYRTCSKGSNGCTSWSAVTPCGDGKTCTNNTCVDVCKNECSKGEVVCNAAGTGYKACNSSGACLVWSAEVSCGEGFICEGGKCLEKGVACENECTAGMTECIGNGVRSCTKNAVGCDVWSATQTCGANETCSAGECVPKTDGGTYEPWNGSVEAMPEACITEIDGRPSVIIDDLDACFTRASSSRWSEIFSLGHDNHLYYAYIVNGMPSAVGTWHLNVTSAGKYTVYAYVDSAIGAISSHAPYIINASGKIKTYSINQSGPSGWYRIDDVELTEGKSQYIQLLDSTSEDLGSNASKRVVFDAIQVVPYGTEVKDAIDPSKLSPDGSYVEIYDPDKGDDGKEDGDSDQSPTKRPMGSSQAESSCSAAVRTSSSGSIPLAILLGMGLAGVAMRRRRKA